MIPIDFAARRAQLAQRMRQYGGGVAVIPTAPEQARNRDTHYPYRPDSYFYWLTGFNEPEAVLVMVVAADGATQTILFCREKNLEREIWDGFRHGPEGARAVFGFDQAYPLAELDAKLIELCANHAALWFSLGHDPGWDSRLIVAMNVLRGQTRQGKRAPSVWRDVRVELDALRMTKDAAELERMRAAARISAAAHRRAMAFARPGQFEYQLEAELLHEFQRQGCAYPAYPAIVAGGANACVLHYVANNQPLKDGDLVLIDAGGEFDGYAADITRCFPANGRFSRAQATIYDLVLAMQDVAIAAVRPDAGFNEPHEAALRVLAQGLIDLKLLPGSPDEALQSESYKRFYMHRTSHWLGMDVHDAGEYKHGDVWVSLEAGHVLTIEPGCYIRAADDVPQEYWNIGVRIEDDVVVTANGCETITAAAPKRIAEIETLMREARA